MIDIRSAVNELVHLRLGSGDDLWVAVASIDHGDAGEAVEVFFTGSVANDAALRALNDHGLDCLHEAGDDVILILLNGVAHDDQVSSAGSYAQRSMTTFFSV